MLPLLTPLFALTLTPERWVALVAVIIAGIAVGAHFFRRDLAGEARSRKIREAASHARKRGFDTVAAYLDAKNDGDVAYAQAAQQKLLDIMADDKKFDAELVPVFQAFLTRVAESKDFAEIVRKFLAEALVKNKDALIALKPAVEKMLDWASQDLEVSLWLATSFGKAVKDNPAVLDNLWPLAEAFVMHATKNKASCQRLDEIYQRAHMLNCMNVDLSQLEVIQHQEVRPKQPSFSTLTQHRVDATGVTENVQFRQNVQVIDPRTGQLLTPGADTSAFGHLSQAEVQAALAAYSAQRAAPAPAAQTGTQTAAPKQG